MLYSFHIHTCVHSNLFCFYFSNFLSVSMSVPSFCEWLHFKVYFTNLFVNSLRIKNQTILFILICTHIYFSVFLICIKYLNWRFKITHYFSNCFLLNFESEYINELEFEIKYFDFKIKSISFSLSTFNSLQFFAFTHELYRLLLKILWETMVFEIGESTWQHADTFAHVSLDF